MIEESKIQELLDRGTEVVYDELVNTYHRTDFWEDKITNMVGDIIVRFLCDGEVVGEVKVYPRNLTIETKVFYKKGKE